MNASDLEPIVTVFYPQEADINSALRWIVERKVDVVFACFLVPADQCVIVFPDFLA